ncbi:hypothetical protein [Brachybacterium sp. P6-10-X1]|uniref:hypothetical protein n=1 Tax=Brachybacterium sp. P6-10-X1 TaxID=1903186 RepID=UPI0012FC7B0F|nr:hypothetical protein [Brachybacterium sp. P6-10-X1]
MAPPAPRRSRPGIWIALGCAVLLILLLLIAVTVGVVHLLTRDGGEDGATAPETVQVSQEYFSLRYPAEWFEGEISEDSASSGMVLDLRDEQVEGEEVATNSLVVYVFDATLHAKSECERQAIWIGYLWDEVGDPTTIDPITLDGKELPSHRALGTHDDREAVSEMYCADVGDQVLQILVETHGAAEVSPEIRAILDSWRWSDAA